MSLLLLTASYGICFGLMNDKIPVVTRILRRLSVLEDETGLSVFDRMLECSYCTGFHAGWVVWCVGVLPSLVSSESSFVGVVSSLIPFSLASSAFCYAADTTLQRIER